MSGLLLGVVVAVAGSPVHQCHYRFNAWNRLVKVRLPGGLFFDMQGELQGDPGARVLRFEYGRSRSNEVSSRTRPEKSTSRWVGESAGKVEKPALASHCPLCELS